MKNIDAEWCKARNFAQAYIDQNYNVIKSLPEILEEMKGFTGFGIEKAWDGCILFLGQCWDSTLVYLEHPALQNIYDVRIVERVGNCIANNGYTQII